MAQTSTSPDQIQSAKYIECRFGTYDDPSAKLYEGPLDTRYSGSYKTRDRSSDSRSQESLVSRDVSEILTKWASFHIADNEKATSIKLVVYGGSTFTFDCRQLVKSKTRLAMTEEVHALRKPEDSREMHVITLATLQEEINTFTLNDAKFVQGVMETYKMFIEFGCFDSKFANESRNASYSFKFQVACIRFAHVVKDDAFEQSAIKEILHVWIKRNDGTKMPTPNDFRLAITVSPCLDRFFFEFREKAKAKPNSPWNTTYFEEKEAHPDSWKIIMQRWEVGNPAKGDANNDNKIAKKTTSQSHKQKEHTAVGVEAPDIAAKHNARPSKAASVMQSPTQAPSSKAALMKTAPGEASQVKSSSAKITSTNGKSTMAGTKATPSTKLDVASRDSTINKADPVRKRHHQETDTSRYGSKSPDSGGRGSRPPPGKSTPRAPPSNEYYNKKITHLVIGMRVQVTKGKREHNQGSVQNVNAHKLTVDITFHDHKIEKDFPYTNLLIFCDKRDRKPIAYDEWTALEVRKRVSSKTTGNPSRKRKFEDDDISEEEVADPSPPPRRVNSPARAKGDPRKEGDPRELPRGYLK